METASNRPITKRKEVRIAIEMRGDKAPKTVNLDTRMIIRKDGSAIQCEMEIEYTNDPASSQRPRRKRKLDAFWEHLTAKFRDNRKVQIDC